MSEPIYGTGDIVRTKDILQTRGGMIVARELLDAREPGQNGKLVVQVPGHGGEVWHVKHDDGTDAVYCYDEFDLVTPRDWVTLVRRDDWGTIYYTLPDEGLSPAGAVSTKNVHIDLRAGDVITVRWPNGMETRELIDTQPYRASINDMGHSYNVDGSYPCIVALFRGVKVSIDLEHVQVRRDEMVAKRVPEVAP